MLVAARMPTESRRPLMRHICPALLCLLLLLPSGSLLAQEAELDEKAKELELLK